MEADNSNFSHSDGLIMKELLTTLAFVIASFNTQATEISLIGNNSITITNNNSVKKLNFDTSINGYTVKCSGDKIILWGKPTKFNEGNPQDTNVILVNLNNKYQVIEKKLSEGVFDVEYLKNKNSAFIGTGKGLFINLNSGQVDEVKNDFDPSDENNFESCDKSKSWEFNRYN